MDGELVHTVEYRYRYSQQYLRSKRPSGQARSDGVPAPDFVVVGLKTGKVGQRGETLVGGRFEHVDVPPTLLCVGWQDVAAVHDSEQTGVWSINGWSTVSI